MAIVTIVLSVMLLALSVLSIAIPVGAQSSTSYLDRKFVHKATIYPFSFFLEPTPTELDNSAYSMLNDKLETVLKEYISSKTNNISGDSSEIYFLSLNMFTSLLEDLKTRVTVTSVTASFLAKQQEDVPSPADMEEWISHAINTNLAPSLAGTSLDYITKITYASSKKDDIPVNFGYRKGPTFADTPGVTHQGETNNNNSVPMGLIIGLSTAFLILAALLGIIIAFQRRRIGHKADFQGNAMKTNPTLLNVADDTTEEGSDNEIPSNPRRLLSTRKDNKRSVDSIFLNIESGSSKNRGPSKRTERGDSVAPVKPRNIKVLAENEPRWVEGGGWGWKNSTGEENARNLSSKSNDDSSVSSGSYASGSCGSGWTIETEDGDSTALKTINPVQPILPALISTESFERDNQAALTKDMLTCAWNHGVRDNKEVTL